MDIQSKIITLAILIVFSGFFSGVETAFFSVSLLRVKHLVKQNVKNAVILERLKEKPKRMLITILIGNNIVNIGASALATSIAFELSLNNAVSITTGVMTFIILVFGEITPKSVATKNNEKISLAVAKPMMLMQFLIKPVVYPFEKFTDILTSTFDPGIQPVVTEEEIKTIVSVGQQAGQIEKSEKEMIHRIFMFDDLEAKSVMTPRNKMVCVDSDQKVKDIAHIFAKKGFTRLPVFKGDLDHIIGFVHLMDIQDIIIKKRNPKVEDIIRKILFVPNTIKLDSLLKFFQRKKQHMAIVVDEFGTNIGLITMEDVVEEIVGEIIDETEKIEPMIKKIGKKRFLIQGRADIDEIKEKCMIHLPDNGAPYSISSYILKKLGKIPSLGQEIDFDKCVIKIESMDKNSINELILIKK